MSPSRFELTFLQRQRVWRRLWREVEKYLRQVPGLPVAPTLDAGAIRADLARMDFRFRLSPQEALDYVLKELWKDQVHTPHPRYYGLFNPAPTTMGIAADALAAAFNPQLAAWSHSPFANEVESHLIRSFGREFGFPADQADGVFTSGGAEANHTALLTALVRSFPDFRQQGLRALDKNPVLYVSSASHHSFIKAARCCGLGDDAVRVIEVDELLKMNPQHLRGVLQQDRQDNRAPFFLAATAGTTSAGVVDALPELAEMAEKEHLWFHVDAAWGGGALFVPELRGLLAGIEKADSITFDAHKWLSVPMAAGMYLTRHRDILTQTFAIQTDYMPRDAVGLQVTDPYSHSLQWSRRFIGLKVFLSLLVHGWDGYAKVLRHQIDMGDLLRKELSADGWRIVNDTPLPVVCFQYQTAGESPELHEKVVRRVVASGEAWVSTSQLDHHGLVIRACITNYRTDAKDVRALVRSLKNAREWVSAAG